MEPEQTKNVNIELSSNNFSIEMTQEMRDYLFKENRSTSINLGEKEILHLIHLAPSMETRKRLRFLKDAAEQGMYITARSNETILTDESISITAKKSRKSKIFIITLLSILIVLCFVMWAVSLSKHNKYPFIDIPCTCHYCTSLPDMSYTNHDDTFFQELQHSIKMMESSKLSGIFLYSSFFFLQILLYVIYYKRKWKRSVVHWILLPIALLFNIWIYLEIADFKLFEDFVTICKYIFGIPIAIILFPVFLFFNGLSSITRRR